MTFPGYSGGGSPGNWGLGANGSIPGMGDLTQSAVTDKIANEAMQGSQWPGLGGMLVGMIMSLIAGVAGAILNGFGSVLDAIFGTVNNNYIAEMPIINDHSQSITEMRDAIEQMVLQGLATKFETNGYYTPPEGILSVEVIIIAAGAGGGAGRWDFVPGNRGGGAGGGGGGEVHASIPESLLPRTGGAYDPITITIGAGGSGGGSSEDPGNGGGNTSFGSFLTAGGGSGGQGGRSAIQAIGGASGAGMIPGGVGGDGAAGSTGGGSPPPAGPAGNSVSAYDLHGGGGGGGGGGLDYAGSGFILGSVGGIGGIWPGGALGQPGTPPTDIVATGGGGGGGAINTQGAAGAYPAGGGGGGWGAGNNSSTVIGGAGGDGVLFIIERSS
ncbi:hypothetical protein ATK86_5362 [Nocardia fluminea]|uniref:Glycine-rich domain-containing protein n=2 Tax=Nocardia fluminea TaxID=134984 RepID=A0A2N3VH56_9NOCA|nr:hypothetical protein ATK86_5362 [Nocardia fluminea]